MTVFGRMASLGQVSRDQNALWIRVNAAHGPLNAQRHATCLTDVSHLLAGYTYLEKSGENVYAITCVTENDRGTLAG